MANRPSDFNTNTPTGASSPRQGDDELRKIKLYTQNFANDLTQPSGAGIERHDIYGETITASESFEGNLNGDVTGDVTGNATTATSLETSRNFNIAGDITASNQSFDGSADISLTATIDDGAVDSDALATDAVVTSKVKDDAITSAKIASLAATKLTGTIDDARLPSSISSDITGNAATASTADKWDNARTITLAGSASGSVSIDGSSDVTLSVSLTSNVTDSQDFSGGAAFSAGTVTVDSDVTWTFDSDTTLTLPDEVVEYEQIKHGNSDTPSNGDYLSYQGDTDGKLMWVTPATANNSVITISSSGDVTANSTFSLNQTSDETITLSIAAGAVDTAELAADAVTGAEIEDAAVDKEHFATTAAIPLTQVTVSNADSSYRVPFLDSTDNTEGDFGMLKDSDGDLFYNPSTGTLTATTFSGALATSDLTGTITSAQITDATIVAGDIANSTITAGKLADTQDLSTKATTIGRDSGDRILWTNNSQTDFYVNGGVEMRIESDGDVHADGDVIAFSTTISDIRRKKDIEPIVDAVSKVNQLGGYTYTYKHNDKSSAGVIAQEVEKVLPVAVREKKLSLVDDEVSKVVNYDALVGLLVEAVKELSARVEELENDVQ